MIVFCKSDLGMNRIWTVEDLPSNRSPRSKEEEFVENHLDKTTRTEPDGRYSVILPFKTNVAIKRFFSLERKLK